MAKCQQQPGHGPFYKAFCNKERLGVAVGRGPNVVKHGRGSDVLGSNRARNAQCFPSELRDMLQDPPIYLIVTLW